jgi:hypothetical protein
VFKTAPHIQGIGLEEAYVGLQGIDVPLHRVERFEVRCGRRRQRDLRSELAERPPDLLELGV